MRKIAILGGAFDPPTIGHLKLASYVYDTMEMGVGCDGVWLMPCYSHLYGKDMENPIYRVEMCMALLRDENRLKRDLFVSDFEINIGANGSTYKTMLELQSNPDREFSIIIGMDNANTFDKWHEYKKLREMVRFIVVSRGGEQRDESVDWYLKEPHVFLNAGDAIPESSSTELRQWVREVYYPAIDENRLPPSHPNMDNRVLDYIRDNDLYRPWSLLHKKVFT